MYDDSAFSDEIGSHYVSIAMALENYDLDRRNYPKANTKNMAGSDNKKLSKMPVCMRGQGVLVGDIGIKTTVTDFARLRGLSTLFQ